MKKVRSIDLFAGCGGLTEGFAQTKKYELVGAVEWDKRCCETLAKRMREKWHMKNTDDAIINFDIQRIDELINGFNDKKYGNSGGLKELGDDIDIIIGGPPCQAYSLAGRIRDKNGMRDDYRNYLFESYAKLVDYYKPKMFVFENVLGLLSAKPGGEPIVNKIRETFANIGYYIIPNLRNAVFDVADFGIPQHRRRIIILGVSMAEYTNYEEVANEFYSSMNKSKVNEQVTVNEALAGLPKYVPDDNGNYATSESTDITWHIPRKHSTRDQRIFAMLANDIKTGSNKYADTESLKQLYCEVTGKKSNVHKYYVLRNNEPSNTIPAHLHKDGLRHIHPDPDQKRSITVREAARLQTFPDDFVFCGSMSDAYKMIGNAVPPKFAKVVAENVYKLIKGD